MARLKPESETFDATKPVDGSLSSTTSHSQPGFTKLNWVRDLSEELGITHFPEPRLSPEFAKRRIGIDWGGPIAMIKTLEGIKYPLEHYHLRPEIDGAIEGIKKLVEMFGAENIYIIRNAYGPNGERNQQKEARKLTKLWFKTRNFFERTGVLPDHVLYPRTRQGKQKICEQLGITDLVDDRAEVAKYLKNTRWIVFSPEGGELVEFLTSVPSSVIDHMMPVINWSELVQFFTNPLSLAVVRNVRVLAMSRNKQTLTEFEAEAKGAEKTSKKGK